MASLNPWRQNAKWRKLPTYLTVTEPNYVRIPIFLHVPRAHQQGQICICGFMRKICFGKKVPEFPKVHRCNQKKNINRFRVPIHFATNHFTFEIFPPPPPFLHPGCCTCFPNYTMLMCRYFPRIRHGGLMDYVATLQLILLSLCLPKFAYYHDAQPRRFP